MKKTISNFIMYIILILVSITMLVPFVWMFLTAFKTVSETMQIDPFVIIPKVWQVQNFENVIKAMDFVRLYANTLGMVGLRILFATVLHNYLQKVILHSLKILRKKLIILVI